MSNAYDGWEKLSPAEKRERFDSHHRLAEIDFSRRQNDEMARLQKEQQSRNADHHSELLQQQEQLQTNLEAQGWRKTIRDITGRSDQDQEQLEAIQMTLDDGAYRDTQEQEGLRRKHEEEDARRLDDIEQRRAYVEKRIAEQVMEQQPEHKRVQAQFEQSAHRPMQYEFAHAAAGHPDQSPPIEQRDRHTIAPEPLAPDFNDTARQDYVEQRQAEPVQQALDMSRDPSHGRD